MSFAAIPTNASLTPTPFTVAIPDAALKELQLLLKYSKIAPDTYENLLEDRRYGISSKWIREMKEKWQSFDWYVRYDSV